MAKLEIPSIVVHSGSPSVPGLNMDRPPRTTPQLRKQKSSMDDGEAGGSSCLHSLPKEESGGSPTSSSPTNCNASSNNNNDLESPPKSSQSSQGGGGGKPTSPRGGSPKSVEVDKSTSGPQPQLSRSRSNGKMKMLTRSHAMREATSPPPDPSASASSTATATSSATASAQSITSTVSSNSNGKNNSQASKHSSNNNNGSSNHHTSSSNNSNGSGHNNNNNNNNSKSKNGNNNNKNKELFNFNANRHRDQQMNKNVVYISSPKEAWGGLLSREYSTDMQCADEPRTDLDVFIAQQMTTKNRALLLRVEEELVKLVQDTRPVYFRFPQMSSFHRMIVHRGASYFNLDHNLDSTGNCVVVNRNRNTKMPGRTFLQVMRDVKGLNNRAYSSEEPQKSILKRDYASFEDSNCKSDEKQLSLESRRSKSFEEREEEYERARRRIFSRDDSTDSCNLISDSNQDSMEDVRWSECATWSGDEPEPPGSSGRFLRPYDRNPRLMKTESYESRESLKGNSMRSAVSKSYSFGGYTGNGAPISNSNGRLGSSHGQSFLGLHRGDSNASSISSGSRVLAKQDSGSSVSSRLSPSSSGYKSQSVQSDATLSATPSPTATPHSLLPMSSQGSQDTLSPEPPVIWPMTALGNIPPGSVLINPATGQPICNADGSVYRYDPDNPLTLHIPRSESPAKPGMTNSSRQNDKSKVTDEAIEEENSWANQSSQPQMSTPKVSPHASTNASSLTLTNTSTTKADSGTKPYQSQSIKGSQSSQTNKSQMEQQEQHKGYPKEATAQDKRSNPPAQHQYPDSCNGHSTRSTHTPASTPSLSVPSQGPTLSNAATSPMLVASPQRPVPAQASQPLVVGGPGAHPGPHSGAQAFPMPTNPMMSMVPYPLQGLQAGVPMTGMQMPGHYHNGVTTYGYATADGQYYAAASGVPSGVSSAVPSGVPPGVPAPYHPLPYSNVVGIDPAYAAGGPQQQQQASTAPAMGQAPAPGPAAGPAPGSCCAPGYPCPYVTSVPPPGPPPAAPHPSYDQRTQDASGQAVNDMTNYLMSMNVNGSGGTVDQRAGGDGAPRSDGSSPQQGQQGPGAPQTAQGTQPMMVTGTGTYYWGPPQLSSQQGYPPTVMYYYPPNNVNMNMSSPTSSVTSPAGSGSGSTPGPVSSSNATYNRGSSPATSRNRENKGNSNSSGSPASSTSGGSNWSSHNRNVAASYAKGAAIYQSPVYSNAQVAQQAQDRTVINGYPNDCMGVATPQQPVVYTVSSMHSSTVPTQSYQPAIYSSGSGTMSAAGSGPPSTITYYQGAQGVGDAAAAAVQSPPQPLMGMNPYVGPQGYIPGPGTPPLTPQGSYGVHPYMYGMYSQTANGPGGPASPATYQSVAPHQSPMMQRMMRPNMVVQSSPPPRHMGPKGYPRGQSPVGRKDQMGSGDNIRFSVPMYNLAASRYMSGDMRYMPGRLPFSIPTNTYHRAIRPYQPSYYPRPHSQPSGEALSLTRPPRVRKPT